VLVRIIKIKIHASFPFIFNIDHKTIGALLSFTSLKFAAQTKILSVQWHCTIVFLKTWRPLLDIDNRKYKIVSIQVESSIRFYKSCHDIIVWNANHHQFRQTKLHTNFLQKYNIQNLESMLYVFLYSLPSQPKSQIVITKESGGKRQKDK
jgi:hypothetical protein